MDLPTRGQVKAAYVIMDVEVIINPETENNDYNTALDIMSRITDVVNESARDYVNEDPEESEYESEWKVYGGKWAGVVTLEQWLQIADNYQMDLDWVDGEGKVYDGINSPEAPVLPDEKDLEETMGSLTEYGLLPAVSIRGIDEGWGYGGYEPDVIISMYVSFASKEE